MAGKLSALERVYPPRKYSVIELPAAVGLPGIAAAVPGSGHKCSTAEIMGRKYSIFEALPGRKLSTADLGLFGSRRVSNVDSSRHRSSPRATTSHQPPIESIEESPESSPVMSPRSSLCDNQVHKTSISVKPEPLPSPSSSAKPSLPSPAKKDLAHAIRLSLSDVNVMSTKKAERSVSCYGAYLPHAIALTALPAAHLHLQHLDLKPKKGNICKQIRAVKNLLILSAAFMLNFTGFNVLRNYHSILRTEQASSSRFLTLTVFYAAMSVSGLFSSVVTNKLTPKWTIVMAFVIYSCYFGANLYPVYYTIIPTSVIAGLISCPLWNAQTLYLYATARKYAVITEEVTERVLNRFNRIFSTIYNMSIALGNTVAVVVFTHYTDQHSSNIKSTASPFRTKLICGAQVCTMDKPFLYNFTTVFYDKQEVNTVFLIMTVFLGCGILATILSTVFMDRFEASTSHSGGHHHTRRKSTRYLMNKTVRVLQDSRTLVLLALMFFTGLEQGFVYADFTKSYVFCALRIQDVGYTMICYGLTAAATVITISHVTKHINRLAIMTAGLMFHICLFFVLWLWKPAADDQPIFYVVASGWALCDVIWNSQLYNMIALLMGDCYEHAYVAYYMVQAAGLSVAFGCSPYVCTQIKICLIGGTLVLGLGIYSIIELRIQKLKKELIASF